MRTIYGEADLSRPLTPEQKAELEALAALPYDEIDFSNIPELPES